jgi:predicted nucleic acid-binding protein
MTLVLDSTLALSWFFRDKQTDGTRAILHAVAKKGAAVPQIFRLEVANGLQSATRLKLIEAWYRDACLADLNCLPITTDLATDQAACNETLRIASRFSISLYAASYLELAQRRNLPLAALDNTLVDAAKQLHLQLAEI